MTRPTLPEPEKKAAPPPNVFIGVVFDGCVIPDSLLTADRFQGCMFRDCRIVGAPQSERGESE